MFILEAFKYSDTRCGNASVQSPWTDLDGVNLFSNIHLASFVCAGSYNTGHNSPTVRGYDSIQFQVNLSLSHHYKRVRFTSQSVFRPDGVQLMFCNIPRLFPRNGCGRNTCLCFPDRTS